MALDRDPNHVFRDFVTDGLPSSGNWNPRKPEIRQLLTEWWQTLIALVADAGELELPNLLISMTVTGGDENNIIAEANLPVPSGPGVAVFSIVIEEANTGPVTINGKPLLSNTGNPLVAGALAADGIYLFLDNGDSYRLLSDYVSSSIVAAAEAAQAAAEAAQTAAESAAGANLASADSVTAAKLTNIPGSVNYVRTAGFDTPGDGRGALYKRASSEPSHDGKFQSADGAWWEFVGDYREQRKGNLVDRFKAAKPPQFAYLFGQGVNNFRIGWGYGRWKYAGDSAVVAEDRCIETGIRADADGLLRIRGVWAGSISTGIGSRANNQSGTPSGSDTTSNYYTTTVGFTWDATFTGTGFKFKTFSDDRGGVWRFTIDGGTVFEAVRDVSVYSSTAGDVDILVIDGLPYGTHTVTAEFQGNDPNNAPSDGTARGWFKYNSGDSSVYAVVPVGGPVRRFSGAPTEVTDDGTVFEFAICATPVGSGWDAEWVPNHAAGTVTRNITRNIYVDGTEMAENTRLPSVPTRFKTFSVVQQYEGYNANDTEATTKMWDGVLTHTYHDDGTLEVVHEFVTAVDLTVTVGYMAMLAGDGSIFSHFVTDEGDRISLTIGGGAIRLANPAKSVAFVTGGGGNYALAMDVSSVRDAVRFNLRGPGTNSGVFLVQNDNGNMKAYFQAFNNEVIPAGSRFAIRSRYYFGVLQPLTIWA